MANDFSAEMDECRLVCRTTIGSRRVGWKPASSGWIKTKTNGAFVRQGEVKGFWVLARDMSGSFMDACGGDTVDAFLSTMIEAIAFLEGVEVSHRMGFEAVEFEMDAKAVLDELAYEKGGFSLFGHICETILLEAQFIP